MYHMAWNRRRIVSLIILAILLSAGLYLLFDWYSHRAPKDADLVQFSLREVYHYTLTAESYQLPICDENGWSGN